MVDTGDAAEEGADRIQMLRQVPMSVRGVQDKIIVKELVGRCTTGDFQQLASVGAELGLLASSCVISSLISARASLLTVKPLSVP